jgi:CRISPR-associated protein Csx10
MERMKLKLTALSPLCISDKRSDGQFHESAPYIPGAVLRGAAAAAMSYGKEQSDAFQGFFASNQSAIFCNAYPAPYVLPATAMSCKAERGFLPKNHGVEDTLVKRLCFESLQPAGLLYQPKCSYCKGRLERYQGFYRKNGDRYVTESVTHRLLTRVAINRSRATAEDQLLYSPIVISEGKWVATPSDAGTSEENRSFEETEFTAIISVAAHADLLRAYLERLDHIGSGTSRGLGQVKATVEAAEVVDDLDALRHRREALNEAIKTRWDLVKRLPGCLSPAHSPHEGAYFTIALYADAILKEHELIPVATLNEKMLEVRCGVTDESLKLVRAYSSYGYRGGWNTAWGLPKDTEVVVLLGGVFVFWTKQPEMWDGPLLEIEQKGIGERTAEGFGQVRICDEFHHIQGAV